MVYFLGPFGTLGDYIVVFYPPLESLGVESMAFACLIQVGSLVLLHTLKLELSSVRPPRSLGTKRDSTREVELLRSHDVFRTLRLKSW